MYGCLVDLYGEYSRNEPEVTDVTSVSCPAPCRDILACNFIIISQSQEHKENNL